MKKTELYFVSKNFFHFTGVCLVLGLLFWFQNVSAQSITISPSSASSIQTSRSLNNIDLIKTGTNNTSGFRFYQSASLRGGLFYNDADEILNFSHTPTTAGIVWNTDSQRAGIGVKLPGGRLHILTNSTDSVPHILIQENNDSDGGRLNFENFGVADKHWTLYGRNSNLTSLSSNAFNIYHSSFGNVAQFYGDGNTQLNGFTQLGSDAPKIKVRKFTGVLGSENSMSIEIDISRDKIISFNAHVKIGENLVLPNDNQNTLHYRLRIFQRNYYGNNEIVFTDIDNNLNGQPYTVFIVYEE